MSILIKGMTKPKDCIYCNMYNGEWYDEELGIEFDCMVKNDQADACPLIEIPTPHGRMIDRSVLFEEYQNLCNGLLCRDCPFFKENSCSIEEWILNQPPIVEAEE